MRGLVVTGTDTGVGKTVFAAALAAALGARYWKPVQSGLDGETDSETAIRLGLDPALVLPESYRLTTPASPHLAARLDGTAIAPASLTPPATTDGRPLVIEGAGGLLVPLTDDTLFADLFARWTLPAILCARTALGGINHALLSLEALRARRIPVLGVAFIGDDAPETVAAVARFSGAKILGRLPRLDPLTADTLAPAFRAAFNPDDFR